MSFSAAGAPLCCHQLKLFPDGRNYPKSRKMFPNMPVLCLGCQSYSVTASLFCHILPQRHIQSNHREQVPALKKWFEGPKCWKEGGTEQLPCKKIIVATNSQRCHHIHSEVDSIAVNLFGNMTAKTGEMLNKTKECKYQYQNKRSK